MHAELYSVRKNMGAHGSYTEFRAEGGSGPGGGGQRRGNFGSVGICPYLVG